MLFRFKQFLSPPVFPDNPDKTAVAKILNAITLLLFVIIGLIIIVVTVLSRSFPPYFLLSIGGFVGAVVSKYLTEKGNTTAASWLIFVVFWATCGLIFVFTGGVQAPSFSMLLFLVVLAGILLGWRIALAVTLINGVIGLLLLWAENQGKLPYPPLSDDSSRVWFFYSITALLIVLLMRFGFGSIREALARAQDELHQRKLSEERFAKVYKASPNALLISELESGVILDVNDSFEKLSGYQKEIVVGTTATELGVYGDKRGRRIWVDGVKAHGFVHDLETSLRHKNGEFRTCLLSIEAVELEGKPCVITFVQDISERKQIEAVVLQTRDDLRAREAQLRTILNNLPFWVWMKDVNGRFLLVNELLSQTGPGIDTRDALIGKTDFDITTPELAQKYLDDDQKVMETLMPMSMEESVLVQGEIKIYETFKAPFIDDGGQVLGTFGFARDITDRKQAEVDREMLIQELERRNAELERFAYTVSHDLKSPLVTIGGFLGFLERDAENGNKEQLKKDIDSIWQATNRMRLLLDELLELSRIGRLINPPEEVPFAEIVAEALALTQGQLMACAIEVMSANEFPHVIGDRARLVEVVQNLVDNAAKFSKDQPQPTIKIGVRQIESDPVFFVQDNGIGIPPQHHDKIFDIFIKLNPDVEGTGVGLALVKRIVEVHNGRLWVESDGLGQGSTFYFTINETEKSGT